MPPELFGKLSQLLAPPFQNSHFVGVLLVVGYQTREERLRKEIHRPLVAVARPDFLDGEQTPAEHFLPVCFYA